MAPSHPLHLSLGGRGDEFLRARIADADPNRAWSNFEFISGGTIYEVDVFLLTRKGAF